MDVIFIILDMLSEGFLHKSYERERLVSDDSTGTEAPIAKLSASLL